MRRTDYGQYRLSETDASAHETLHFSVTASALVKRGVVFVPLVDQLVSAGEGTFEIDPDRATELIPLPSTVIASLGVPKERLAWVTVTGDSMSPTIMPGQQVLVIQHQGEALRDRGIYVLMVNETHVLKRVYTTLTGFTIRGDNEPVGLEIGPSEREYVRVVGRVAYTGQFL